MISNLQGVFSKNAKNMKKSAIRELLKLTQRKEVISFAGGLPAPESFPLEELKQVTMEMLEKDGIAACQYGTTEGDPLLRKMIVEKYREEENLNISVDNVIIVTSSQQALDFLGKVFLDEGDKFICCLPTYLGALQAFNAYAAVPVGIKIDNEGMSAQMLEETLAEMKKNGEKPKFIYTIPDFQNPAGITMTEKRREEILKIAYKYDVLVVEDSPYRELRFEGTPQKMMYALDDTNHVITLGTFSKIFVPGFRIGWIIAHPDILDKFVTVKQSADLCTSPFVQKIAARYMEKGYFRKSIANIVNIYRDKRDIMLDSFKKYMPAGVTWTEPQGGLFLFLTLPDYMDAEDLFKKAVANNVAFVLGSVFYCDGGGRNTMRINFSYCTKEQTVEGVKRLAKVITDELRK